MTSLQRNLIDGRWVDGPRRENWNPARPTEVVSEFAIADPEQAREAAAAARRAQAAWESSGVGSRSAVLARVGQLLHDEREPLAHLLTSEEGKLLGEARAEVTRAAQTFYYYAHQILAPSGELYDSQRPGVRAEVRRRPHGVVGLITPWNFPVAIPAWKMAPALAYGNTVVLKPAELTPASTTRLVEIMVAAGVPAGVVNLVNGPGAEVGGAVVGSTDVDAVSFTGSVDVGREVAQACLSRGNKRFQLEMGGSNPLLVLADADLATAVRCAVDGAYGSTGQRCTATSRIFVERTRYDQVAEAIATAAVQLRPGHPADPASELGPLVSASQHREFRVAIDGAQAAGAVVLAGAGEPDLEGHFAWPTLLAGASAADQLAREEVFGPAAAIVPVDDLDDGIAQANATHFGLSASVVTSSAHAAEEFARRSNAGIVSVNLSTAATEFHLPFGGRGSSNHGPREQGTHAKDFYTVPVTHYSAWGHGG